MGKVVVGWDGSAGAEGALRWAASEAARRHADVAVVRSWIEPVFGGPSLLEAWEDPDALERQAKEELEAAVRAVADEHPDVTFRTHLVGARPADAVLHASGDPTAPEAKAIRDQVRAAFLDDDPSWLAACADRYRSVVKATLAALG